MLVISNVVDSSMAREADAVLYTRAGPEIGVAATKTHLAQITALEILALYLGQARGTLAPADARSLFDAMGVLPDQVATAVGRADQVEAVALRYRDSPSFIFLGRQVGYPVALEGALKLKELSYLRAEGFPGGELKHGPIALVEPGTVVIGVATRTPTWGKMMANVAEVKSRGATVVLVANDDDEETARQADAVLWVPPDPVPVRSHRRRGAPPDVRLLRWPVSTVTTSTDPATWPRWSPSSEPGRRAAARPPGCPGRPPSGSVGRSCPRCGARWWAWVWMPWRWSGSAGCSTADPTWPSGCSPPPSWPTPGGPPTRCPACAPGSRPRRRS